MAEQNTVYDPETGEGPTYRSPPDLGPGRNKPAGDSTDPRSEYDPQASPKGDASDPRDDLRKAERSGGSSKNTGGLFNPSGLAAAETAASAVAGGGEAAGARAIAKNVKNIFWGSKKRKRNTIGGSLTAVAIGGAITVGTLLSGPFEFVHIAQLLEQFHFSNQQNESDDRVSKLVRYAHYSPKGDAYKTNLNYVGNKLADKFEAKLNEQGLKSAYTKLFGLKNGYIIDRNNQSFKGLSDKEIKQHLQAKYNDPSLEFTTITDENGTKQLFMKQPTGFRVSRGITRETLKEAGYGKVMSAIGARIMGERDGVTWHPLQKLDNKLYKTIEEKYAQWNKEKAQNISKGEPANPTAESKPQDNPNDTKAQKDQTAANANGAAAEGNSVSQEGSSAAQAAQSGSDATDSKLAAFNGSLTAKITAGGVAAAGVLCMARGIAQNTGNVKQSQTALPLIRTGVSAISRGNQTPTGQDIDINQLGNDSKQLYDSKTKQSWYNAQSIQAELGKPNQGVPPDGTLKTLSSGSPLDFLVSGNPLADALNPICSTAGIAIQTVVGFLGGPVSALGGTLISAFLGPPVIDTISHYLAGQAVSLNPAGPKYGNYVNFGAFLAANDQGISNGGRALSSQETTQLADAANADVKYQFERHGLAYRLFNPRDHMSLVSSIMDRQSGSVTTNVGNVAFATANIGHSLITTFSNIFSGVAQAASQPYNYGGEPEVAFSENEMDNSSTENPYANGEAVANILNSSAGPDYISLAQKCFGDTLQQTSVPGPHGGNDQVWDVQYGTGAINIYSPDYKKISSACNNTHDRNWLKIRFFIFDTQNIKAANCYQGDDQSCSEMGFDSTNGPSGDASAQTPAAGNAQQLAQQILANKNIDLACLSSSVQQDVKDAAAGKPGTAGAPVSSVILQLIATVGQSHKVCVTAIESDGQGHSTGSYHYTGDAVDFGSLDGVTITGRNAPSLTIIKIATQILPSGSAIGQSQCGSTPSLPSGWTTFDDTCNHLHIQVPRGTK